jgi:hypothetical protein
MASRSGALTRIAAIAACLGVAATTTAARAEPTAADRETARGLMDEGRALRDRGDLKEAMKRFKAADDIMHVPTTGLFLARTQAALGLLVEARDTIQAIRRTPVQPKEPAAFSEARASADALDASLHGRVPALTIVVTSADGRADVSDATVAIDGIELPSSVVGLPRSVDPGHHVVTAKARGSEARQELDIREGEKKRLELALAAGGATGSTPSTRDDQPASTPDTHEIAPSGPRSHAPDVWTFAGLAVAAAGVGVGAVTGVMALSKQSTLQGECANKQCGPSSYADLDSAHSLATVSDVAFAVAGGGAAVAIVSLLIGHAAVEPVPPPSESRLRVVPWIGVGAGGVAGSF